MGDELSVLHVEDDPTFAEIAAEFLRQTDDTLTVVTEVDPESALNRLRADPGAIDCVVSDYGMPAMDGLELLEAIRSEWPDLPFILFTGRGSEEIAAEAISAGVTDYIQKDADSDTYEILSHRIRNAVERRRAQGDAARTQRVLEGVIEQTTDVLAVVNRAHEVVFVSAATEALLGASPAELRDRGPFGLVHPDDRTMVRAHFERRLRDSEAPAAITVRARHTDGHHVRLRARAYDLAAGADTGGILVYTPAPEPAASA